MKDLPDAAIEAAAAAIEAHYEDPAVCAGITNCNEHVARAAVEAAMPAIREAIAQEIEESTDDFESPHWAQAIDAAARIVRGGTP